MRRLTTDKYPWALRTEYYKARKADPQYLHLRFGQWVWNTYGDASDSTGWPELFYEQDENKVLALLCRAFANQVGEEG